MDRTLRRMLAAVWIVTIAGCQNSDRPPMAPVSGTVLYQNQPIPGASVTFFPETTGQRSAGGVTDDQGRFVLMTYEEGDGAVIGKHRVAVVKRGAVAPAKLPPGMGGAFQEELDAQATEMGKPLIPQKYFLPENSGLEFTVEKGNNEFKLELKD